MAGWVKSVFRRDARVISYGPRHDVQVSKDDVQHFASAHGLSYGSYYLFVGRLVPEKGVRFLVEAFSKHPDKALAIVGSDPFGGRFERELRRTATPNVRFLGGLYGRDYVLVSLGAFANIRPTLDESEGVNPVTIEAMGFGLPIIASNVRQNQEALGDCAVYFDANSEKTLHEAIERVHSSEDLRRRLGGIAKERALNQYSWDAWFSELMRAYDSVVDPE
jgi:glycosyltransferase involved in cell wall biosynthesis